MTAKRKSVAVSTVSAVSTDFDGRVRESEIVTVPSLVVVPRVHARETSGDSGDSGDSYLEVASNKLENVAEAVSTQELLSGDSGDSHPGKVRIAFDEALDVAVLHWAQLPTPSSIRALTPTGRPVWLTASRQRAQEARAARIACFAPVEYEAAFVAVRSARATVTDLERWCDLRAAGVPLSPRTAVAGADGLLDAPALLDLRWGRMNVVSDPGRARPELLEGVTMREALASCGWSAVEIIVESAAPTVDVERVEEVAFAQL